ncbi:MAG: deferrochelatase/peroxidase EfeB, partial [Saprospiraceae bacterium]
GISNPRFYPSQNLESNPGFKPDDPSELNVVLRRDKLSPSRYACGSFVVFLKLEQDVEAFNEKVEKLAEKLDMTDYEGYVAAYMMGRHKDGTPLHELFNYPSHGKSNLNDFDFENDPKGEVCPFHSHIRKANARDGQQKRIVRRGKIYGNKKAEQKGLLFLSYQSSLYSFEKIVNSGLYGYNYKTKNTGQDVLFVEKSKYVKNHRYPNAKGKFISPYVNVDRDLITYRGGLYFFTSSISFIRDYLEYCM